MTISPLSLPEIEVDMVGTASHRLKAAIKALAPARPAPRPRPDVAPGCAFGAVVEQRLRDLERELREVKQRVNGLIFVVIGAVLVEIVMRLLR